MGNMPHKYLLGWPAGTFEGRVEPTEEARKVWKLESQWPMDFFSSKLVLSLSLFSWQSHVSSLHWLLREADGEHMGCWWRGNLSQRSCGLNVEQRNIWFKDIFLVGPGHVNGSSFWWKPGEHGLLLGGPWVFDPRGLRVEPKKSIQGYLSGWLDWCIWGIAASEEAWRVWRAYGVLVLGRDLDPGGVELRVGEANCRQRQVSDWWAATRTSQLSTKYFSQPVPNISPNCHLQLVGPRLSPEHWPHGARVSEITSGTDRVNSRRNIGAKTRSLKFYIFTTARPTTWSSEEGDVLIYMCVSLKQQHPQILKN